MSKKCKKKISNRCLGDKTNATCVDYEGDLIREGRLSEDDCYNVEEVIDFLGEEIDEILEDIDLDGLGCCMEYTVADVEKGLTPKDVLSSHEGMLCDHEERLNKIEENCCNEAVSVSTKDDCGVPKNSNVIFIERSFGTGAVNIDNTYGSFKTIPVSAYSDLYHKCEFEGTYEIVVETEADATATSMRVGLSNNNLPPNNNPFEQTKIEGSTHNTTHFIIEAEKNDQLRIQYKKELGNTSLTSVKMIVKLIEH